jgi:hypothetical protein
LEASRKSQDSLSLLSISLSINRHLKYPDLLK